MLSIRFRAFNFFRFWLTAVRCIGFGKKVEASKTDCFLTKTTMPHTNDKMNSAFETNKIITKFDYPTYTGEAITDEEEITMYNAEGDGMLQHLLAMVSDCLYHYEKDDDFHDGDMKMAYLTMKKAWESGGDTKPFMATISRNRKALSWANITLIWLMVLPQNDAYWGDANLFDFPEDMPERKREGLKVMLTHFRNFRNGWKKAHEEGKISKMLVGYGKDGYGIHLYGKKTPKPEPTDEDPTA